MIDFEQELDVCFRARFPLIVLVTREEERALSTIKKVCDRKERNCYVWDQAEGISVMRGLEGYGPAAGDAAAVLAHIDDGADNTLYVLKDFHECWVVPQIKRKLRSVAQRLKYTKKTILVITPSSQIPEELKNVVEVIDFPPPDTEELDEALAEVLKAPGVKVDLDDSERDRLLQAALGLSTSQAQRVFARAIVSDGVLNVQDIETVTTEKRAIIRESGALEFYPLKETPDDVGGLGVLKEWLHLRSRALSKEAREYGLPPPKGIALIGIPGTGKSLSAKMIGSLWRLPLLRLDVGALYGSYVGESEQRVRQALRLAETVAPCVVWLDEMEKALAHGGNDSGTSTRVFGTILTWMAEKTAPCFICATANNISALPPELLRRGRFDEIFFLDLPTFEERKEIFSVHLKKRKRDPQNFDTDRLAKESQGYVGAEIEQAVIDGMFAGFHQSREFTTNDVSASLKKLVPLSVSQRENIAFLRMWLQDGRAVSASHPDARDSRAGEAEKAEKSDKPGKTDKADKKSAPAK